MAIFNIPYQVNVTSNTQDLSTKLTGTEKFNIALKSNTQDLDTVLTGTERFNIHIVTNTAITEIASIQSGVPRINEIPSELDESLTYIIASDGLYISDQNNILIIGL